MCRTRVTEVNLLFRGTSIEWVCQCSLTFGTIRLENAITVLNDLPSDLSRTQSIVVLEQHVIFEVTVLLVARMAARKIFAVPAFIGAPSNRKAFA
jgi:hypothetical protein